mmetsp:Transcript_109140/g.314384  ORF Transcript_109140/g.314384 Transcript_109140/m.314384 type:complete len:97 (-) Transcript_109140:1799-2089(-)
MARECRLGGAGGGSLHGVVRASVSSKLFRPDPGERYCSNSTLPWPGSRFTAAPDASSTSAGDAGDGAKRAVAGREREDRDVRADRAEGNECPCAHP